MYPSENDNLISTKEEMTEQLEKRKQCSHVSGRHPEVEVDLVGKSARCRLVNFDSHGICPGH